MIIFNRTLNRVENLVNDLKKHSGIRIEAKEWKDTLLEKEISSSDILINTTPIGMYPSKNKSPLSKDYIHEKLMVFDVIYNPLITQLLRDATEKGCKTLGGLDMLIYQGVLAFEWWTSKKPNIELMKAKIVEFLE